MCSTFERQRYLQTTEDNVLHYGFIEKFSEGLGEKYNIPEIAFDRWGSVLMVQNLEGRMNKSFRSSNKNGCCIVPLVTFHGYDKLFVKVLKF